MVSHEPPPPLVNRGNQPDAIAPDSSETHLLIDERQGATAGSLAEVTLPAGQGWRCLAGVAAGSALPVDVFPGDALGIPTGRRF